LPPYETCYYARRQHATEMVGGQAAGARPFGEWTVSYAHGVAMGWIDDGATFQDPLPPVCLALAAGVDWGEPAAATPDP
jgi:hypothetical protein